MSNPDFNQGLYEASLQALTANGVPQEVAQKASAVVAKDDSSQPNFGRSPQDQQAVNEAMSHYWQGQDNAE